MVPGSQPRLSDSECSGMGLGQVILVGGWVKTHGASTAQKVAEWGAFLATIYFLEGTGLNKVLGREFLLFFKSKM